MSDRQAAIVVTTIFEPRFLDGYVENLRRFGHDNVEIIVIIDRKTPPSVAELCEQHRKAGVRIACPTLAEQEALLARFPSLHSRIPYDSDNRRNIGFLMALESGAEVLISIDDDNYCLDDVDFVGEHLRAGTTISESSTESDDHWINICSLLHSTTKDDIFPRGFPYFARRRSRALSQTDAADARVAINVGLWLSDPDVDAMTRLTQAPHIRSADDRSFRLGDGTWTPINTQNTAITRDAIAAYYYVRMGFSLGGLRIDRYGDILSGYLIQKCVKTRGDAIRIGSPIADHRRTPHNLFKDLYHELAGMVLLDDLLPWFIELKLGGGSYREMYAELAEAIEEKSATMRGFVWDEGGRDFLVDTANNMRAWLEAVRDLG
jgi:glycosyltransferase involved in cell wall biosynthesis